MAVNLNQISVAQERQLLRTFTTTIQSVKDQATIAEIVRLLEVGNVDGVIELLQLDEATFQPIEEQIRTAYRTGGLTGAEQIGPIPTSVGTLVMRFNMRNPRAEEWLRNLSSGRIVEILEETRQVVRNVLTDGLAQGDNPRTTALDLVGRIDPQSRERVGGFIGLTRNQAGWVRNSRMDLELIGATREEIEARFAAAGRSVPEGYDPARSYLSRNLRDTRLDGAVKRASRNGSRVKARQVDTAVSRYQARALRYRSEVIARTESISSLRAGQYEAIRQAIDKGEVEAQDIRKRWDATGDARTRLDHLQMEQTYSEGIPVDQAFIAPDLSRLMFPGDISLGATGAQTIQCRCRAVYEIDFIGRAVRVGGFQ